MRGSGQESLSTAGANVGVGVAAPSAAAVDDDPVELTVLHASDHGFDGPTVQLAAGLVLALVFALNADAVRVCPPLDRIPLDREGQVRVRVVVRAAHDGGGADVGRYPWAPARRVRRVFVPRWPPDQHRQRKVLAHWP